MAIYYEVADQNSLGLSSFSKGGMEIYVPSCRHSFPRETIYGFVIRGQVLCGDLEPLQSFPVDDIHEVVLVNQYFLYCEVLKLHSYDYEIILVGVYSLEIEVAKSNWQHSSPRSPRYSVD